MSAKLIGKVDWVIQPDSPELSGQEGDETVTVKVTATSKGLVNLPQYGAPFESKDPFFAQFSYLVLTGRSVRLDKGGKTYSVTLTYGTSARKTTLKRSFGAKLSTARRTPISRWPSIRITGSAGTMS